MEHAEYVQLLADLLSRDPQRVRKAARRVYEAVAPSNPPRKDFSSDLLADLALAEAAGK